MLRGLNRSYLIYILLIMVLVMSSQSIMAEEDLINLTVRGADIEDVLLLLTEQSGINLVPDETVQGKVTLDLKEVRLEKALETLTIAYDYNFNQISEKVYLVSRKDFNSPPQVKVKDNMLYINAEDDGIRDVLNQISDEAGINIIMDNSVSGKISIDLESVPLEQGLVNLLQVNGYSLSKNNEVYRIFRSGNQESTHNLAISIVDNQLSIDVQQADLGEVLRTISRLTDINMVIFGGVRGMVDLKLDQVPLAEAIDRILAGTRFTYRKIDGVYLIGEKDASGPAASLLTTSELISLQYLKVEKVPQLLPNNFPVSNVKVMKEQNALLVTGTQSEIRRVREYIDRIDREIPQIVVEALIIELSQNRSEGTNMKLGMDYDDGTVLFDSSIGRLNYKSVMDLPDNFYLKLESLVGEGAATIKANPNITTLNGQQARIDVGNVQYYKVINTDEDGNEETRYDSVDAGVSLEVTPWVSNSGEINLELSPTVSNIGGAAAEGPPQISRREVDTTVRVKDGQTVVIGGLIQDVGSKSNFKVPILGDTPLIGGLFRSNNDNVNQTELVMYITPRVLRDGNKVNKQDVKEKIERTKIFKSEDQKNDKTEEDAEAESNSKPEADEKQKSEDKSKDESEINSEK